MLRQILVKLPWPFEDALGYPRGFRWVAFFCGCGDEAMYDDGYCSGDCNWYGFLQFTRHPSVKPWLAGYDLGSSDDEATHWILCDLESREVFVGERAEVKAFLATEVAKYVPAGAPADSKIVLPEEDIKEVIAKMFQELKQIRPPSVEDIQEKMKRDQEAVEKMVAELGAKGHD